MGNNWTKARNNRARSQPQPHTIRKSITSLSNADAALGSSADVRAALRRLLPSLPAELLDIVIGFARPKLVVYVMVIALAFLSSRLLFILTLFR
jgi:hypothetical protein